MRRSCAAAVLLSLPFLFGCGSSVLGGEHTETELPYEEGSAGIGTEEPGTLTGDQPEEAEESVMRICVRSDDCEIVYELNDS